MPCFTIALHLNIHYVDIGRQRSGGGKRILKITLGNQDCNCAWSSVISHKDL